MKEGVSSRLAWSLFLLSAGALCFEVALLRLYSIQQFYHFAFLVVSLALLGTAAGGTALAMRASPMAPEKLAAGFSASVLLAYASLNLYPFDSYAVAWDRRQIAILALYFTSAALPFVLHGWFTGAALAEAGVRPGPTYAANLAGAAAGPPLALAITTAVRLEAAVAIAAAAGMASVALLARRRAGRLAAWSAVLLLLFIAVRPPPAISLRLSPNKPLAQARLYPQAEVTLLRDGLAARLEAVENAGVHSFPGLSLTFSGRLPGQVGLFVDGDGPLALTAIDLDDPSSAELAQAMPSGIAYGLHPGADSLILRPGAGLEVGLALASGARSVDVAVDEPLVIEALRQPYGDFTRHLFDDPRIHLLSGTSRGVLGADGREYDVIEVALSDPFRPVASGAFSLSESYDLTRQAMTAAFSRLSDDGVLVLTRWLTTPPAESVRAWSMLLEGMRDGQVPDPWAHVIAFRGIRTSTVLASARPWAPRERIEIRRFLEKNGFDPIYLPGSPAEEFNRFNRIPDDPYPDLFRRLLFDPEGLQREYPFRIDPPTDDRPYFYHFFRWRQTPEVLAALGRTWQPFGGSGYLVQLALLALMLMLAVLLVLIPMASRRAAGRIPARGWTYFVCLGAGFVFIEVSLLTRFTLPLERPSLTFAAVLSTLLLASGLGSLLSERVPLRFALLALALLAVVLAMAFPWLIRPILAWPYAARLGWTVLVLAPLGLLMGMPFPAGLRRFAAGDSARVGMSWAINGAASGVAGVLAAMLAIDLGLRLLMTLGGLAYLAAWLALRRPISRTS